MQRRAFASLVLASLIISASASPDAYPEARRAAELWLARVDSGNYAASWQQAGELFQLGVTSEKWSQAAQAARGPLGSVRLRAFESAASASSLPGAPDGQYVVLQFNTSFANKAIAVETVTTALQQDGNWKVVGYFVR